MSHPRTRTLARGIYKRGNSYYLDYKDEAGKRIRKSAGRDLHRALDLLYKVRSPGTSEGDTSLKDVLDSYLASQRVYSKIKSVKNAESSIRRLTEHFGDPRVSEMTQETLDSFVLKRREEGVVDKTINGDLIIVRAALNHGVSIGLIKSPPFSVKLLKVPKRRTTRVLARKDIKLLLKCASGRIYGILLIAAHTGFRNDEILHLQWRDVGWHESSLRVTTKAGIWSSKNHQERTVFVHESLLAWLRTYRENTKFNGEKDWVFSTRNRTPMTTFNVCRAVRSVFEKAGLYQKGRPTLHLIRHTVACDLLANGADLETVRDWLGHADISTTSVYLHTTDERKKDAARSLTPLL